MKNSGVISTVEHFRHKEILVKLRTGGESPRVKGSYQKDEYKEGITANDIAEWIDKNTGKVLEKDVVVDYMNINHNLHPDLKKHPSSRRLS